jgi:hypothetical protein
MTSKAGRQFASSVSKAKYERLKKNVQRMERMIQVFARTFDEAYKKEKKNVIIKRVYILAHDILKNKMKVSGIKVGFGTGKESDRTGELIFVTNVKNVDDLIDEFDCELRFQFGLTYPFSGEIYLWFSDGRWWVQEWTIYTKNITLRFSNFRQRRKPARSFQYMIENRHIDYMRRAGRNPTTKIWFEQMLKDGVIKGQRLPPLIQV